MAEHVALVKRACRICGKAVNADILLATKYHSNGKPLKSLSEYDGQVIGLLKGACSDCKTKFSMDIFYVIIEVNMKLTEDQNNPYLTGKVIQVKKESEFGKHLANQNMFKNGIAYAPIEVINHIEKLSLEAV